MIDIFERPELVWIGAAALLIAVVLAVYSVNAPGMWLTRSRRRILDRERGLGARLNAATAKLEESQGDRLRLISAPLDHAGMESDPARLVIILSFAAVLSAMAGFAAGGVSLALLMLLLVPLSWRAYMGIVIARRRRAFRDQLDETLQMLAASLRAGYGLLQALGAVANDAEEPTKGEFTRVLNETRVGLPLGQALEAVAKRLDNEDFDWVGQAIAINREVGGNLADVLDGVAGTIRERNALRRQVRSLSAEGRMSAMVLYVLPIAFSSLMLFLNPSYMSVLFTSVMGWLILGIAGFLMIVGGFWLRTIVNIKY